MANLQDEIDALRAEGIKAIAALAPLSPPVPIAKEAGGAWIRTVDDDDDDFKVVRRSSLLSKADVLVPLGTSPDGLPWLLRIRRSMKVEQAVLKATGTHKAGEATEAAARALGSDFEARLRSLVETCDFLSASRGLRRLIGSKVRTEKGGTGIEAEADVVVYATKLPARATVGQTLLAQALDGQSPRAFLGGVAAATAPAAGPIHGPSSAAYSPTNSPPYSPAYSPTSPAYYQGSEIPSAMAGSSEWIKEHGSEVYLLLDLRSEGGQGVLTYRAPVTSLNVTDGGPAGEGKYDCDADGNSSRIHGPPPSKRARGDVPPPHLGVSIDRTAPFVFENIEGAGGLAVVSDSRIVGSDARRRHIYLDRRALLLGLAGLCKTLESEYHRSPGSGSVIHGDLVPANILITRNGLVPVDPMRVKIGDIAPGGTMEWAAPEQLVGLPVQEKTDMYPLALMATALLGGLMWGEVTEYARALREKGCDGMMLRTVKVIKEPQLAFDAPVEISDMLESALCFDAKKRPSFEEFRKGLIRQARSDIWKGSVESEDNVEHKKKKMLCWLELLHPDQSFGTLYKRESKGTLYKRESKGKSSTSADFTSQKDADLFWVIVDSYQ